MRVFVCVFALFVVALAKPQYNYNSGPIAAPQLPVFNQGQQQVSSPQYSSSHVSAPQTSGPQYSTPQVSSPQLSGPQYSAPQVRGHVSSPQYTQQVSTPHVSAPHFTTPQVGGPHYEEPVVQSHEAPLITKQFYLHSAPEDHSSVQKTKHIVLGRPQKNYRVVFIKNPSDSNANVKLSAEFAPQEEKTVIYVLSKKDSSLDIENIATPAPTQPSKPEVFFIKYKTPEEAAHAQREIQNQYNVLGGTTSISDEGHAPLSSVVGSLNAPVDNHALNTLGNEYLPARKA